MVSTRVGGVPEVLPPDMLLLAEPSPEGLIEAVGQALDRVAAGGRDAWAQHAAVRDMYSWQSIAARTEAVYRAVLLDAQRDDSMTGRLARYYKCGKWFGKICCCVTGAWVVVMFGAGWLPAHGVVSEHRCRVQVWQSLGSQVGRATGFLLTTLFRAYPYFPCSCGLAVLAVPGVVAARRWH